MAPKNLKELFVEEIKDIYNAEQQLTKALPKMAKAVESDELQAAFEGHLEITRMHVERLEEVFKLLGMPALGKTCEGMKGLLEEGKEAMEGSTLDAPSSRRPRKWSTTRSPPTGRWPRSRKSSTCRTPRTCWGRPSRKRRKPTKN